MFNDQPNSQVSGPAEDSPPLSTTTVARTNTYDRRSTSSTGGPSTDLPDTSIAAPALSPVTDAVSIPGLWAMMLAFSILVFATANVLVSIWPAEAPAPSRNPVSLLWGLLSVSLSAHERLMLIAILMGILGSMVHALTSLVDFAGNKRLSRSWVPWYLMRPLIGMTLALIFYLVLRAGLFTAQTGVGDINPYGIAAVAGLAGMFSKQATDKLSESFTAFFRTEAGKGDDQREAKL